MRIGRTSSHGSFLSDRIELQLNQTPDSWRHVNAHSNGNDTELQIIVPHVMVVNWKNESQKLLGNQLIKIGRQFIDENGGDPRGAATKAAPEGAMSICIS